MLSPQISVSSLHLEKQSQLIVLEIICYPTAQASPLAFILGSDKHLTGKGTGLEFA